MKQKRGPQAALPATSINAEMDRGLRLVLVAHVLCGVLGVTQRLAGFSLRLVHLTFGLQFLVVPHLPGGILHGAGSGIGRACAPYLRFRGIETATRGDF